MNAHSHSSEILMNPMQENVLPIDHQRALLRTERSLGAILVEEGKLSNKEIERVLDVQRREGCRFGEAAVRLGLVTDEEVRYALAKQYDFPHFAPPSQLAPNEGPSRELVAAYAPFHPRTEEMRALRTQLLVRWYSREQGRNALVVTSPGRAEGRSYVAANLAIVFSQLGARTLLVDADLRHPRQHDIFRLPAGHGLSTVLAGRTDLNSTFPVPGLQRVSVLPAGPLPPNPQELLSRPAFGALMSELQSLYDVVILDSPAAARYADVQSIVFRARDALVVTRKDHTPVQKTGEVVQSLQNTGARVVGTLINEY
jgi:chain length determinant protein tyrosine kinase EpsG